MEKLESIFSIGLLAIVLISAISAQEAAGQAVECEADALTKEEALEEARADGDGSDVEHEIVDMTLSTSGKLGKEISGNSNLDPIVRGVAKSTGMVAEAGGGALKLYRAIQQAGEALCYRKLSDAERAQTHHIDMNASELLFDVWDGKPTGVIMEVARLLGDSLPRAIFDPFVLDNPKRSDEYELGDTEELEGTERTASMRVKRIEGGAPSNMKTLLILDEFSVEPSELEATGGGRLEVDLYPRVGTMQLPRQTIKWSEFSDGGRITLDLTNYTDELFERNGANVLAIVRERGFWGSDSEIGAFILTSDYTPAPPSPPSVRAEEQKNSINLGFNASSDVTQFEIYKSRDSDFSIDEVDPIATEERTYEDLQVEGGRTYYYIVVGLTDEGRRTPVSEVVSATPRADYRFESVTHDDSLVTHQPAEFSAQLIDVDDGKPVEGASVLLRIDDTRWSSERVTTDANGTFSIQYWAPVEAGSYDVFAEGRVEQEVVLDPHPINVEKRPGVGRNLAIETVALEDSVVVEAEDVAADVQVRNRGDYDEDTEIQLNLRDREGETVREVTRQVGTLAPGVSKTVSSELAVPDSTAGEDFALHVQVQNGENLDERPASALQVRDVHVVEDGFDEPVFQTEEHSISYNETVSIDGVSVSLTAFSDDTVTFEVNGESTGSLTIDPDGNEFWKHSDNDLILFPTGFSQSDSVSTVFAGGTTSAGHIQPQRSVTHRGDVGTFTVSGSEGDSIEDVIDFLPAEDGELLQDWNSNRENERLDDHIVDVHLEVPSNQPIQQYEGWMRWEEGERRYVGRVGMRAAPIHRLSMEDISIDKNVDEEEFPDNIPGMVFDIGGDVSNEGDYVEPALIEFTILQDEGVRYSEHERLVLDGEQEVTFEWPTAGLDTGEYDVRVTVPHGADQSPEDNVLEKSIEFTEPQPLEVEVADPETVYEVGDSAFVETEVTREGEIMSEATVIATVETPGGEQLDLNLEYDPERESHGTFLYANMGGNYDIQAFADRPLTKPGSAQGQLQTYVDVSLSAVEDSTLLLRPAVVNIETSNVGDLHGLSADVAYDESTVELLGTREAGFLSKSGESSVDEQHSDQGGEVMYGVTRLDEEEGAHTAQSRPVASLAFTGIHKGRADFEVDAVDLIDSDGEPMETRLENASAKVDIQERFTVVSLSGMSGTRSLHQRDTTDITIANAYDITGASGRLSYDPNQVRILDVIEGSLFNRFGVDETLFVEDVDHEGGKAEFSVSRTGDNTGISQAGTVAQVVYETVGSGEASFELKNTSLISSYDQKNLPHVVSDESGIKTRGKGTHVSLTTPDSIGENSDQITLAVEVESVEDLYSFAGDVNYDPSQLTLQEVEEGDFLSEGGEVSTSFTTEEDPEVGDLVVGMSRLGSEVEGVSTEESKTLFEMTFDRHTEDSLDIDLLNTGLVRPDGETEIPHTVENLYEEDPEQPSYISLDIRRAFGSASGPQDYRLVALPGAVNRPLSETIEGDPEADWQAFWDDGTKEDFLLEFDGSETFHFRPGRGFWMTSTEEWTVSDSVESVALGKDGKDSIPLNEGWNIVSNPLDLDVDWDEVVEVNDGTLQPIWTFEGGFNQADTFRTAATGQAYYFLNDQSLDSLTIPSPTSAKPTGKRSSTMEAKAEGTGGAQKAVMTLLARKGEALKSEIQVGISRETASGLDPRDVVAPPARFSTLSLRLVPDGNMPEREDLLAAEWRPPASGTEGRENGHTFSLRLQSETSSPVEISAKELSGLKGRKVLLLDPASGQSWDLRGREAVTLRKADSTALKLAVGSAAYVEDQAQKVMPDEVTLTSYPNPMRRQATIEYTLTDPTDVRVTVYDVLGRRVAVLEDDRKKAGRHQLQLDGGRLASGVYFGRLKTEDQTLTEKITILR